MWWLELILILIVGYVAYRQSVIEQRIEALDRLYNELADLFDKEFDKDG